MDGTQKKKLTGAAAIVMSSIIVSRITGFVREVMVPNFIGVDGTGDAYNLAFRITGLMYDMLVGGAIAAALIPVLTGYITKKEEQEGWKAVGTFINVVFIVMSFACVLGMIFAPQIVPLIALGLKEKTGDLFLTVKLTRILFPSVAFLMLAGLTNGVLNSYQRFAAAAYGPSIYNIGSALSIFFLSRYGRIELIAYGVMCSSVLYFLFQLMFALPNLKYYKFKLFPRHSGFTRLMKLAVPSLLSSSIVQVNVIISSTFATFFNPGSVTLLQLADRTWQMPYGVFAQGIGIALLPTLSANLAVDNVNSYKNILLKGLKTVLLFSVPSAIGMIVLREPVIRTIFKFTSKMDENDVIIAGSILAFFSIALLTQSTVTILNRAFYAKNDTKTPLYIGAGTIVVNIALSWLFYRLTNLDVAGMALSYSLASTLNAILLLVLLNRKMNGIYLGRLLSFMTKVVPASLIMGLVIYFMNLIPLDLSIKWFQFMHLIIIITAGAIVYFAIVLSMKVEEAMYVFDIFYRRFKKIFNKYL